MQVSKRWDDLRSVESRPVLCEDSQLRQMIEEFATIHIFQHKPQSIGWLKWVVQMLKWVPEMSSRNEYQSTFWYSKLNNASDIYDLIRFTILCHSDHAKTFYTTAVIIKSYNFVHMCIQLKLFQSSELPCCYHNISELYTKPNLV